MNSNTTRVFSLALTLAAAATQAGNILVNGTFEGGDTSGWTALNLPFATTAGSCSQGFAAQTTASGCVTGINPVSGSYAAYSSIAFPFVSGDVGEWIQYLNQDFVVPTTVSSAILTWSDSAVWGGSGSFRGVDVIMQLYNGNTFLSNIYSVQNPSTSGSQAWTNRTWDITSFLQANPGATLTLKFTSLAFFDTRSSNVSSATTLISGLDNVALNVPGASATPEPATIGLIGTALAGLGLARLRKRA